MLVTKTRRSLHYKSIVVGFLVALNVAALTAIPTIALAIPIPPSDSGGSSTTTQPSLSPTPNDSLTCPSQKQTHSLTETVTVPSGNGTKCILDHIVAPIVAALVALTGVLVVISLIIAGIQYSSSSGDPSKIAAARKRIMNAVIALLSFMFLYAFIKWIIPGGITNGG